MRRKICNQCHPQKTLSGTAHGSLQLLLQAFTLSSIEAHKRHHQQCLESFSSFTSLSSQLPQTQRNHTMQSLYSILVFFVAAFATIGLCASAVIRKRRTQAEQSGNETEQSVSKWQGIKKILKSTLQLKDESDAAEAESGGREKKGEKVENSAVMNTPLLWQRRILMGERCEMPKFSGLILYDERGRPLQSGDNSNGVTIPQEKPAAPVVTLKDLM